MYLFLDTETNGLPKDPKAPMARVENWPRVIQLAYSLYNEEQKLLYKYCELIKPDGWIIPTFESLVLEGVDEEKAKRGAAFFEENGYTTKGCEENGVPIHEALYSISVALENCKYVIAHNMMFDYNVLGAEMIRANTKSKNKPIKVCTKELATEFCKIPNPNSYWANRGSPYKWPNLTELHTKLFGKGFEGAHDAMFDVNAMSSCFFEMLNKKIIVPNEKFGFILNEKQTRS